MHQIEVVGINIPYVIKRKTKPFAINTARRYVVWKSDHKIHFLSWHFENTWQFAGQCDEILDCISRTDCVRCPGQKERRTLNDYGVHGGGHPEGHPGIDFMSTQPLTVRAPADMALVRVQPNSDPSEGAAGVFVQFSAPYRDSELSINITSLSLAPGISPGTRVKRGDPIGTMMLLGGRYFMHFGTVFSEAMSAPRSFFLTTQLTN